MTSRLLVLTLALALCPPALAQQVETRTANDGNVLLEGAPEVPEEVKERLNRYQNVRSAGLVGWTEAGRGVYVSTRFADLSQLHRVDAPGGSRHQLTFYREPVLGAQPRPASDDVLFLMDEGGSEFWQLFLFDTKSRERRRLTDGSSRNSGAEWSDDGRWLAFTSTRRTGRSNDVWLMNVADTSSARLLVEADDGASWGAADWSPDGSQLLVGQYISINDSRLHLVDVATGERRLIAGGGDDRASWLGVSPLFSADGGGVFLATDAGSEFTELAHLELASGDLTVITGHIPWDVEEFALSQNGRRAAFVVNEHGYDRLYLMDASTFRDQRVENIPDGLIGGLEFSPDDQELGMTISRPGAPSDVYSLDLGAMTTEAGRLTRWTESELGGLDPATFVTPELIEYQSFDGRMIPAFVYRPRAPGPHPVVIQIHGGPESQSRPGFSASYQMWVQELGAAVIRPNVRGSAGYGKSYLLLDNAEKREDSVKDIGALLDWIAQQPGLDANRVAVYGGSYGGYMVLASLVQYSNRLRAGVELVGISNFVTFLENTQEYRRDLRRPEYGDERDPEMRAFLESISPSNRTDEITAPLFVAQGANDPRVPASESRQIVDAVRASGYDVWYMLAKNEGHGFRRKENADLFQQLTLMFLEEHLLH
ncbi:MAG: prolyl oligopeptidase family serine peptidase [Longimicrobiaceae bacterium]